MLDTNICIYVIANRSMEVIKKFRQMDKDEISVSETEGKIIGENDQWIAAHALATNAVLVTNNLREFERVPGLRLENWV
jgi:predicted nucleic acid-binding protein